MGEPSHHQQPFESKSPQDPKSSQLLVCAYDLLGAVRVDATQDPFALHFHSKSQPLPPGACLESTLQN